MSTYLPTKIQLLFFETIFAQKFQNNENFIFPRGNEKRAIALYKREEKEKAKDSSILIMKKLDLFSESAFVNANPIVCFFSPEG